MYSAHLSLQHGKRGLAGRWHLCRVLVVVALASIVGRLRAQEAPPDAHARLTEAPAETERAMPGLITLGAPQPQGAPWSAAAGVGYGWMDETKALEGGHRLASGLALAYAPLPALALGIDMR